ncbi:hypothetical protein DM01DRAFT_1294828 [Hesseltinella vesiculosa]|uniref:Amino acid transporter transmembrane domain-containing protein n=1 Tax=Hesseltinella vesiculosa TaxID=101127 RepID=A0A1X2G551_9FUNG|nr:hypothetical protein DM01DRAFT_1294828 [Hesseltinella vesiculosa]
MSSLLSEYTELSAPLKSSYLHSVFNAVNVLIGVGVLALPFAFRITGWALGTLLLLFCCFITNYTAKVIIRCLEGRPGTGSYGDMGAIAFGPRGRTVVGGVFVIELITIGVAMIILLGDALMSIFSSVPLMSSRIIAYILTLPTLYLPIRKLAYGSFVGIVSCFALLTIVLYDGITKRHAPGSLLEPQPTNLLPSNIYAVPLSFGLIMSGFTGHAVFPAIHRDMEEPKHYSRVVNTSYVITIITYVSMAWAGYTMFGDFTLSEITQNLANIQEYNQVLNGFVLWLVFLTPISKYGVMMTPLIMTLEKSVWSWPLIQDWCQHSNSRMILISGLDRLLLHTFVVGIAIAFPNFDRVMSLLGSLFSFGISVIFPLLCHFQLFHQEMSLSQRIMDASILAITFVLAILGTAWSFFPQQVV